MGHGAQDGPGRGAGVPPPTTAPASRRLEERAQDRLHQASSAQSVIVAFVAALVILRAVTIAFSTYFLLVGENTGFRIAETFDGVFGALIDIVVLFLVLILFDAIRRIDREADRTQTFMDNMYRRLP